MPNNDTTAALAQDLAEAIDDLQAALLRASDAASRIKGLVPRVSAVNALLDEIESVIQSGRREIGSAPSAPFTRPTLVATPPQPERQPDDQPGAAAGDAPEEPRPQASADITCFRLEFQSNGGPLDLRAVDDAVSEHPAVRDVALIDYDGRNATLKVWIVNTVSPAEVQQALSERASQIFADGSDVTIVALEDAA